MAHKTIGIMGGLGPAATVDFLRHVVSLTATTPLRTLVDCNPTIPDVSCSILGFGQECSSALVEMALGLEKSGAEVVVLACNAAHHYQDQIRAALTKPFLSMIDVTASALVGAQKVGLLAAESCLFSGVYQKALSAHGIETVILPPAENAAFNDALSRMRSGDVSRARTDDMLRAINYLALSGATSVILGCTEVPLVVSQADTLVHLIDPGLALAQATVQFATLS
jgi:aspartate racemase